MNIKKQVDENVVLKPEFGNDAFGLKNSNYHLHLEDLKDGIIPIELETFNKILETLNIDINSIPESKVYKCYEHIYDVVQITFNTIEENNNKFLLEHSKKH